MKLFELLLKTISRMPNGWGETVPVDLTNDWIAPSDGILLVKVSADSDVAYIENEKISSYICAYAYGGGITTTSAAVYKGKKYKISYKGRSVTTVEGYFTPFSYRGVAQ